MALTAHGQTPVLTQHNDTMRTGQNTTETILNTTNVNVDQFGKLFALPADGQVYAQPLYVPGVTINGVIHNVLIVATENDSVYAYDADSNTGSNSLPLWKASLVDATHGAGAGEMPLSATTINCGNLEPLIGITATPVIDSTSNTVYVEAKSTDGTNYYHRLHALDLLTGHEKSPGPILITATVAGTGDGSAGGLLTFDALHQLARPGLLLTHDTIYIAYASHCDYSPYHGWLFGYDQATFTQKSVYVTTPNGGLGGFWMSGAGVAADSDGTIFIPSGNGDFDTTNVPATETGDSLLKLGTTNQILTLLDYFTPLDQQTLDNNDTDLGSGGALLLPQQSGPFPNILVQAGKEGRIYVVNRDQMTLGNSHYCAGCSTDSEIIEESSSGAVGPMFGTPAYWNNQLYFWGLGDVLKSIPVTGGLPDFTNISSNSTKLGFPGATPSISSNGTIPGTAILWALDTSQSGSHVPAVLYAFDASSISNELWNSDQAPNGRDQAGSAVKFATPTISNGKVYIGTSSEVDVYGVLSAPLVTSTNGATFAVGTPGTFTVTASGFPTPTLRESGALPSGVTFNASSGVLSGTPAAGTNASYPLTFTATNSGGTNTQDFTLVVKAAGTGPTASFLGTDSTTQGNWRAKYGSDGYSIANTVYQSLPSYATFTPQSGTAYSWEPATTDPRALTIPGSSGGVASCWFNAKTFDFNVNITDGNTHQIALYALDWDTTARAETITIADANNPSNVLSTQTVSSFNGGIYLVWTISGDVQINVTLTGGLNAVISGVFFDSPTQAAPLVTSKNGATFAVGTPGTFTVTASGFPTPTLSESGALPSGVTFNASSGVLSGTPAAGTNASYPLTFTATNSGGTNTQDFTLVVKAAGTGPTASFLGTDSTTQGNWRAKYGSDGYSIANTVYQSLPSYATFTPQSGTAYSWEPATTDPRALTIPGSSGGVASCWFNAKTFDFNVNITDGNTHQIALYALDWDTTARAETITIADANNPSNVLSTQTVSSFNGGIYLVWTISGDVQINVTLTGGLNAVISGVFFSPAQAATPQISPAAGSYPGSLPATITDTTSGAAITYTTDGSTPIPGSNGTTISSGGSFTLTSSATVTAIASATGDSNSNVATAAYTITVPTQAAMPQISPAAASYVNSVLVTITDTTSGAAITYTTDGSTPIPGSNGTTISSGGSFTLTSSATVTAIASATGDSNSNVATAAYTITVPTQAATPQISPAAASYVNSVLVTITDTTSGAAITYTTDGSTPIPGSNGTTISSGGSFTLTSSATVTAIASATGDSNSNVATAAYTITVPTQVATPQISPAAASYVNSVLVTITDTTSGAAITYTTDGSTPIPGSNGTTISSGGSFTLTSSATVTAIAAANGMSDSVPSTSAYTITAPSIVDFSAGFAGETTLTLNGSATINGSRLRLTDGGENEAGGAFFSTPTNIQSFATDFSFQLTNANADGFTFTIQCAGATALGAAADSLGYGPGSVPGIPSSVAVKFDFFDSAGQGNDSTGLYINGAAPTIPSADMTGSGVNLQSGDVLQVQMAYSGTTLTMTITDVTTGDMFTQTFSIDIPGTVGADTAYVGFTAGTGAQSATQDIVGWTYTPGPPTVASPQVAPAAGSYSDPLLVTITDAINGASITYTTDGSAPIPGSNGTTISSGGSFTLTSSATVTAIASAAGYANSNVATAAYTITVPAQAATPQISPAAASYVNSVLVTITDTTSGAAITYTTDGSTPIPGSNGTTISSGGSFTLTSSATVTAIASAASYANSNTATTAYTITPSTPPATPQISPAAATYSGSVLVTITDATSGAAITYTTDGSTPIPGANGTTISSGGSFTLTSSATVTAIASLSGQPNSSPAISAFTVTPP
jgi:predicted RecA/RadA family phage recombinase